MSDQLAGRLGSNCKWDYISLVASHQWSSERLCFRASSLQWLYKYVNHLDTGVEYILSKFVDDAELGGVVDSFEGRKACRYTLIKLEGQESPTTWHLKIASAGFCTGIGAILDLYTDWGMRDWRAAPWKGIWGFWLNVCQWSALAAKRAKCNQVYIRRSTATGWRKWLHSSALCGLISSTGCGFGCRFGCHNVRMI